MGTRAVIHADLGKVGYGKDIWIATHYDGNPEKLGRDIVNSIKEEVSKWKKSFGKDMNIDMGHIIQSAIVKASAEHHIDSMSTTGKKDFTKMYDDFAEYEYEVMPDGTVKVRTLDGFFTKAKKGEWEKLKGSIPVFSMLKKEISKKKLKEMI